VELENDLIGEVKNISIRSTVIRTYHGLDLIVPNSDFISNRVTTWTYGDDWRRLRIPFGVSYDSDPDEVAKIATEIAREIPTTVEDDEHPINVWFEGFGDSSLNFSLLVWCRMTQLKPISGLFSDYYFALFRKFKEAGIEIPFPQRDLHLRSISPKIMESFKKKNEKNGT
jgi:small-conductance mechanosensitive channel